MPLFLIASVLVLLGDQLSKWWIRSHLALGDRLEVWPGVFHLEHVENHGAAWGLLSGQRFLLILFSIVVVAVVLAWAREVAAGGRLAATGLGLILGGALGNMGDRIFLGAVTDFFDVDTSVEFLRTFPVFNVADSALTVGVICLLISQLGWQRTPGEGKPREGDPKQP